ncbi:MAG: 3-hydroxy acid dehydrogenase/malonic semialdehyde reductase [Arenicella sp.]|jgi:3-hydroxy acid dehydrogenase/malonic semialdehyde reductase
MDVKTALITGASAGLGLAIATRLSDVGYQLILVARRESKLIKLANSLPTNCHVIACDVNDFEQLAAKLESRPDQFRNIDLLLNNAGLALGLSTADKADWADWQTMIQTNCMALAFVTRQILPAMVKRNKGLIINLGSTAGNYAYRGGNVYGASKAFVDHFTMNLRADLLGTQVRVTNLVPGLISETEFSNIRFHGDSDAAAAVYANCDALTPDDIANSVEWVAGLPDHVNINKLEIMPTCQAPAGLIVDKTMQ